MENFFDLLRSVWGVTLAILFFGGTIFIHELGHFLAAKKRGLRIERFSIGFGPRLFGWTGKDGVDYRVSLFPLGGYVALPQMADMSTIEGEAEADEERLPKIGYADKMLVAVMGATFNILFAIVLACLLSIFGKPEPFVAKSTTVGYIQKTIENAKGEKSPSPAFASRLRVGDKIVAVDGRPVREFFQIAEAVALGEKKDEQSGRPIVDLTVERDGKPLEGDIRLTPAIVDVTGAGDKLRLIGISGEIPVYLEVRDKNSPAYRAGLRTGDRLLAVNGTPTLCFEPVSELLNAGGEKSVRIRISRTENKTAIEREVEVVPVLLPYTHALLALEFTERGVKRTVELIPAPASLDSQKDDAPHTRLVVREGPPADSEYARSLATGTVITAIAGDAMVQNLGNLDTVLAAGNRRDATRPVSLYTLDEKTASEVLLTGARFAIVPPKTKAFIGITHQVRPTLVKKAPWVYIGDTFSSTLRTLKALTSTNSDVGVRHLTGVIGMARIYYDKADDILNVLWFTLVININLAVMNLLPLPVLDGGHMVYATLEKIRGKALHRKTVEIVQTTFVLLLLGLMAYVIFNDIKRMIAGRDAEKRARIESLMVLPKLEFPAQTAGDK